MSLQNQHSNSKFSSYTLTACARYGLETLAAATTALSMQRVLDTQCRCATLRAARAVEATAEERPHRALVATVRLVAFVGGHLPQCLPPVPAESATGVRHIFAATTDLVYTTALEPLQNVQRSFCVHLRAAWDGPDDIFMRFSNSSISITSVFSAL